MRYLAVQIANFEVRDLLGTSTKNKKASTYYKLNS